MEDAAPNTGVVSTLENCLRCDPLSVAESFLLITAAVHSTLARVLPLSTNAVACRRARSWLGRRCCSARSSMRIVWGHISLYCWNRQTTHAPLHVNRDRPSPRTGQGQVGFRAAEVGGGSTHHPHRGLASDPRSRSSHSLRGTKYTLWFFFALSEDTLEPGGRLLPAFPLCSGRPSPLAHCAAPPSFAWTSPGDDEQQCRISSCVIIGSCV